MLGTISVTELAVFIFEKLTFFPLSVDPLGAQYTLIARYSSGGYKAGKNIYIHAIHLSNIGLDFSNVHNCLSQILSILYAHWQPRTNPQANVH